MDEDLRELLESVRKQVDISTALNKMASEQHLPISLIMLALIRVMPPETKKALVDTLQSDIETLDLTHQAGQEEHESLSRALQIASSLISGDRPAASCDGLRLIRGGKVDPA